MTVSSTILFNTLRLAVKSANKNYRFNRPFKNGKGYILINNNTIRIMDNKCETTEVVLKDYHDENQHDTPD